MTCAHVHEEVWRNSGGGVDPVAFDKLCGLLRYVSGDYKDAATFLAIRNALGTSQRPAHYLAIPPILFAEVVEEVAKAGCVSGARVIVEKPFGHDLDSSPSSQRHSARGVSRVRYLSH